MSSRRASPWWRAVATALVALAVALATAGCANRLPFTFVRYPPVGLDADVVVGPAGDTLWLRRVGGVAVLSPVRAALDSPFVALAGAADVHRRLLGGRPPAMTAVLLPAPGKGRAAPPRPVLPDSFARGAVAWGWYVDRDTVWVGPDTVLHADSPPTVQDLPRGVLLTTLRPSPLPATDGTRSLFDAGVVFPVEYYVAQAWLDSLEAERGRLPAWLEAAVVALVAEGDDRLRGVGLLDRGLRDAPPLDSLFGRRCGPEWRPVPGDPPPPLLGVSEDPPQVLKWLPWLRDRCGYRLRIHARSVADFLVETAGEDVVRALVEDALAGHPVETTLARFPGRLPSTTARLDVAWRDWVRHDREMNRPPAKGPR